MEINFLDKYYLFTDKYPVRSFINQQTLYNNFNLERNTSTEGANLRMLSEELSNDLTEIIQLAQVQNNKNDLLCIKRHINLIYNNYISIYNIIIRQNTRTEVDPMAISNMIHQETPFFTPIMRDVSNMDVINAADNLLQVVSIFIN